MKNIIITIIILILIGGGYFAYIKYMTDEENNMNSIPEITQEELSSGWYWGETKRPRTPEDWILIHSGTRGAKWTKPE